MSDLTSILRASLSHFDLVMPVKYTAVISLTWVALDVLETFPAEVAYIWPSPLKPMKILFFVNRYLPFFDMPLATTVALGAKTPELCAVLWPTVVALYWTGSFITEVILIVRTAAIWAYHPVVLGLLIFNCLGLTIPSFVMVPRYFTKMTYPPADLLEVTGCLPSVTDFDVWVCYAGVIVSETVMVVLLLLKQYISPEQRRSRSLLIRVTLRDGAGLYVVMLVVSVANMLFMTIVPKEMSSALQLPHRALHTTLCSRVLLNLREAGAKSSGVHSNDLTWRSTMHFVTGNAEPSEFALTTVLPLNAGSTELSTEA